VSVRPLVHNGLVLGTAVCAVAAYLGGLSQLVSPGDSRTLATVFLYSATGVLSGALLKMPFLAKLGLITLLPIAYVMIEVDDPAKIGLKYLVGLALLACLWLGALIGHFAWGQGKHGHA
jgi:hypothetical protein